MISAAVIGEQYFWGVELQRIGVAPQPIWLRTLTHTALAKAITEVLNNPRMTSKAQQIALSMKNEDGVSAAVNILQEAFE